MQKVVQSMAKTDFPARRGPVMTLTMPVSSHFCESPKLSRSIYGSDINR
ncbi:MAG: hypothetical protein NT004_07390 [Bacteroidetes bacterium]|nr:hypothetical protein [Bacteroidota bacterium]